MQWLTEDQVRAFLRSNGLSADKVIEQVLEGFDFDKPIYEHALEEGADLFQYIRKPSATEASPRVGGWFCLPGATTRGLAIIDGGAGRRLHHFVVQARLVCLEGIARSQARNWDWSGGGPGGTTQIYIPPRLVGHLRAAGAQEHW